MLKADKYALYGALGLAAILFGYVYLRGFKGAAADMAGAAVNTAAGLVEGATTAAGSVVGIPKTDRMMCDLAKRNGSKWDASKYCSAGEFATFVLTGK